MEALMQLAVDPAAWAALVSITAIEIVLGIDNLVFISVISNKLPEENRSYARRVGIAGALVLRLIMLATIAWIIQLTEPLFELFGNAFSWRDLILIAGGLFLVWKATSEIHHAVDPEPGPDALNPKVMATGVSAAILQILLLDTVFSIDSIITAVGMTPHVPIMVIAILITVTVMLIAADPLGNFVHNNPTIVMLALAFLLLIGTVLIADGFGVHVPRGYIYAAMAFSAFVEGLNMAARRRRAAAQQHESDT
ncbi:MAG: TerC family protein [Gammaproteobacteria bacterium]|nr:TerC family protein [Gammaproteobacteria bacterium]